MLLPEGLQYITEKMTEEISLAEKGLALAAWRQIQAQYAKMAWRTYQSSLESTTAENFAVIFPLLLFSQGQRR